MGDTMTWRITITYIERRWYVSMDMVDEGRVIAHSGGDFTSRWQAMEFIDAEIERAGDDRL